MRIKFKSQIEVSSIADNVKDIGDISIEAISDLLTAGDTRVISLIAGVSNYLVSLDTNKIKFVFVESDKAIEIKLGDINNTAINITPMDGTTKAYYIATLGGDVDRIYLTNLNATSNATVRLVLIGK